MSVTLWFFKCTERNNTISEVTPPNPGSDVIGTVYGHEHNESKEVWSFTQLNNEEGLTFKSGFVLTSNNIVCTQ